MELHTTLKHLCIERHNPQSRKGTYEMGEILLIVTANIKTKMKTGSKYW